MVQGVHYGWIKSTRALWAEAMELAESSGRLDPRSAFAFQILSYIHAHGAAITRRRGKPRQGAVELNPYDMGARGMLGMCISSSANTAQAIELFSTAVQRGNTDPQLSMGGIARVQPLFARTI